jgi:2-keto-4-pentenoate hydratase/2-oxohepta-3-ene-1,7-dioic acid hydratase in catechol pathway/DNA-binding beta-propeller fold protein YncE
MNRLIGAVALALTVAATALEAQPGITRYVRYEFRGRAAYGILDGERIRELSGDPFSAPRPTGRTVRLADVRLLSPLDPMRITKVLGVAINTRRPGREEAVAHPRWFAKLPTSLVGPDADVEHPPEATNLDWEGELVLVIGRRCRHVTVAEAPGCIFGVSVGNDFSENTWYGERQGVGEPTRLIAKAVDTWAALGPAIVTGVDHGDLRVDIRVNGETVATGRTSQLLNNPAQLVSYLSRYVTLLPGDLLYTGTYPTLAGRDNTVHPGDVVEVEIESLGTLRNRVVPMRSPLPPPPVTRAEAPQPTAPRSPAPPSATGGPGAGVDPGGAPQFQVDPFWPRELPNNWIIGQVSGVAVGPDDHVWIVHRPRSLTAREVGAAQTPPLSRCCIPAPPVIEFDQEGAVVRAWGGPGNGAFWPQSEHGIHVDRSGDVWIASNGRSDHVVLKFSPEGRLLLQIGRPGETGGSNDTLRLGQPTGVYVDAATNEVYVADGYRNRRVIVFDATTGAYQRHWGAYGRRPVDGDTAAPPIPGTSTPWPINYDTTSLPQQFNTVHAVRVSSDRLVYVADRINNRIQVFRTSGEFVREAFVARATRAMGSVWDIAFSPDTAQSYLVVPDGSNMTVWILRRSDLSVVGNLGRGGRMAGQFGWVHSLAVDSRGNLYTGEVDTYKRVQRFVPPGTAR